MTEHFTATVNISKTSTPRDPVNRGGHQAPEARQVDKEVIKLVLRAPTFAKLIVKLGKHIEIMEDDSEATTS